MLAARMIVVCICMTVFLVASTKTSWSQQDSTDPPSVRQFKLEYSAKIREIPAGSKVRVWIPVAKSTHLQKVDVLQRQLPVKGDFHTDSVYGNKILYFEVPNSQQSEIEFSIGYEIARREHNALSNTDHSDVTTKLSDSERSVFLSPNRMVPITGEPLNLIREFEFPAERLLVAKMLYDRVDDHMKYGKSLPGYGNGDVVWACKSQTGNCTDFHSVFISLARSRNIPAHFEIGFPLPEKRGQGKIGGYHCWANFFVDGRGWVPVDISEADKHPEMKKYYFGNLTENRVSFSIGRDIQLHPPQAGPPLNYFVYPYVEVDGKAWSGDKTELAFSFEDVAVEQD